MRQRVYATRLGRLVLLATLLFGPSCALAQNQCAAALAVRAAEVSIEDFDSDTDVHDALDSITAGYALLLRGSNKTASRSSS